MSLHVQKQILIKDRKATLYGVADWASNQLRGLASKTVACTNIALSLKKFMGSQVYVVCWLQIADLPTAMLPDEQVG